MLQTFKVFLKNKIVPYLKKETTKSGSSLANPIIYSLLSGGKRIRAFLIFLFSGTEIKKNNNKNEFVYYLACALESLHTYSLIHDDLPSMDNDDLRRGKPSCHKKFSEWQAILAGDGLQILAFDFIRKANLINPNVNINKCLEILINGAGVSGMLLGQALDLESEAKLKKRKLIINKKSLLKEIHFRKTAKLIVSSILLGASILNLEFDLILTFGLKLGLLFQIKDDILDVIGDKKLVGKTLSKDENKLTYPKVYGLEKSELIALELVKDLNNIAKDIINKSKIYNFENKELILALPEYILKRNF